MTKLYYVNPLVSWDKSLHPLHSTCVVLLDDPFQIAMLRERIIMVNFDTAVCSGSLDFVVLIRFF